MADFPIKSVNGFDFRNNTWETLYTVDPKLNLLSKYSIFDKFIQREEKYNVMRVYDQVAKVLKPPKKKKKKGEDKKLKPKEFKKLQKKKKKNKNRLKDKEPIACKLCCVICNGKKSFMKHQKGRTHTENLKAQKEEELMKKCFISYADIDDGKDSDAEEFEKKKKREIPIAEIIAKAKAEAECIAAATRKLLGVTEENKKEEKPFGWTKADGETDGQPSTSAENDVITIDESSEDEEESYRERKRRNRKQRKKEAITGWIPPEDLVFDNSTTCYLLRAFDQPVTYFGESLMDRRARLQAIIQGHSFKAHDKKVYQFMDGYIKELKDDDEDLVKKKAAIMNKILKAPKKMEGRCDICGFLAFGKLQWDAHLTSSRHLWKLKKKEEEAAKKMECICELCCVTIHGEDEFQKHLDGRQHQKALEDAAKDGYEIVEDEEVKDALPVNVEIHVVYEKPFQVQLPPGRYNKQPPPEAGYEPTDLPDVEVIEIDKEPTTEIPSYADHAGQKLAEPEDLNRTEEFDLEYPDTSYFKYTYEHAILEYAFRTFGQEISQGVFHEEDEHVDDIYSDGCRNCGAPDHLKINCPKDPKLKIGPCFACGHMGHVERECFSKKCWRCGDSGHYKRECKNKKEYFGNEWYPDNWCERRMGEFMI